MPLDTAAEFLPELLGDVETSPVQASRTQEGEDLGEIRREIGLLACRLNEYHISFMSSETRLTEAENTRCCKKARENGTGVQVTSC